MIEEAILNLEEGFIFRWLGLKGYQDALDLQLILVERRIKGEIGDTILFLEHPPTITKGRGACEDEIRDESLLKRKGIPVYEVARGGRTTYHGPGQLLVYPVIDLKGFRQDVHWYLRRLEDVIIETLMAFGIKARRIDGYTGVWVENKKIASIGVGIKRWVTHHGIALNVNTDLSYFEMITSCGIDGVVMTSMERLGVRAGIEDVAGVMKRAFYKVFL